MTADHQNLPGLFELHQKRDIPSEQLLVVFSAANATNFTFFKSTENLPFDRLHVRDPEGGAWYQNGLLDGEGIDDTEARIRQVAKGYKSVWMLGSSMGGFAALYFGCRIGAHRVLAIAPQILVDSRFSRGPRSGVTVQTSSIADLVRGASETQCTIVFGSFDLVDIYNISQLYLADNMPLHLRVLQYTGQDHMLPVRFEEDYTLERYFKMVLSENTIPEISIPYVEGRPLDADRFEVLARYIQRAELSGDPGGAYEETKRDCEKFPDWHALHYYWLHSGYMANVPPATLLDRACELSDLYPTAIDFAYLAALCCEGVGDREGAYRYLSRVFSIRKAHPGGRQLKSRLDVLGETRGV